MEKRNVRIKSRYDTFSKPLEEIPVGSAVIIQNPTSKKWKRRGKVVQVEGRRYIIRVNGSNKIITRNRRFLKQIDEDDHSEDDDGMDQLIVDAVDDDHGIGVASPITTQRNSPGTASPITTQRESPRIVAVPHRRTAAKEPLMLRRLRNHNEDPIPRVGSQEDS